MTVIDCLTCLGTGCLAGNGETCPKCKGWGSLAVAVLGPYGRSEIQTEDIEIVYASLDPFEEWDRGQAQKRTLMRLSTLELLTPEWTLG